MCIENIFKILTDHFFHDVILKCDIGISMVTYVTVVRFNEMKNNETLNIFFTSAYFCVKRKKTNI